MKKAIFLSLVSASILTAGDLGVELGVSQTNLEADFEYGNAATRTKVDEDLLGLDDKVTNIKPRVYYTSGNHTFDFDYESLDFSGSNTLTKNVVFDDKTYAINTNVRSTMEFDWYRLGYKYSLVNNDNSNLKAGIDLNILDTNVGLDSDLTAASNYSETIPLPTLVLNGKYSFNENFAIEGKFAGLTAGSKGSYTEAFAGLNIKCLLLDNAHWRLGYQTKKLEIDVDDFDGELKFSGGFIGFNYKF